MTILHNFRDAIEVDRDDNASSSIRDWSHINPFLVETSALSVPRPLGTDGSSNDELTHHIERARKTTCNTDRTWSSESDPRRSENETLGKNLENGASGE